MSSTPLDSPPRHPLKLTLLACAFFILGCCCCCGGGSNEVGEELSEQAMEHWLEQLVGGGDVDLEQGELHMTMGDGNTASFQEGQVPEGFPLPVYEGATVLSGSRMEIDGSESMTVAFTCADARVKVADFYAEQLADRGILPARFDNSADGATSTTLVGEIDNESYMIMVSEQPGQPTTVSAIATTSPL